MSFENKAEQVGVLSPYSMNPNDIGKSWKNLGAISGAFIRSSSYLGSGIAIAGDDNGHIFRSADYGANWVDLGLISNSVESSCYIGNGITVIGDFAGHIFRSTDYGVKWTDLGLISPSANPFIASISYIGNGIVIAGDGDGRMFRSTDYGASWNNLGLVGVNSIYSLSYLDNGIVSAADYTGHVLRSTDYGATWVDLGLLSSGINDLHYLENGIVIFGDDTGNIFRSVNFGLTWVDLGVVGPGNSIEAISYLGNGISVCGDFFGHMLRSTNYGLTWTDLGDITGTQAPISSITYLGNGVVIATDWNGRIFRSDVSYKTDEVMPSVSVGMSGGIGNTSGTSGLAYQRLVIAGGNNITLSHSISSGSATLTISAGTGGGGTNVTVFQPAQGMDITDSGVNLNSQSVNFYRVSIPASIVATEYDIIGDMRLASNSIGAYTLSYGVYTMTGSTANLASSTSVSSVFASGSQTSASSRYGGQSGMRYRSVSLASWNFVPGEYLFAMGYLRLGNVSMELVGPHRQSVLGIPGGGNYSKYFYDGAISSAGAFLALPSSVQLSAITRTGDNLHVWWMALAGTF